MATGRNTGSASGACIDENGAVVPLPAKNIAMFHPLRRATFPLGTIHLQGDHW